MKNIAVILAGGTGSRFGGAVPKQFLPLEGREVIEHSLATFCSHPAIDEVVVVVHPEWRAHVQTLLERRGWDKVSAIIDGGSERWQSSWNAVCYLEGAHRTENVDQCTANVLLHDAARPWLSADTVSCVVEALEEHAAVAVAVPATDTLFRVADGCIADIPPRAEYYCAQTPQAFRLVLLADAYRLALQEPSFAATDDCGVLRRYRPDIPIRIVPGSPDNTKITHPRDLG